MLYSREGNQGRGIQLWLKTYLHSCRDLPLIPSSQKCRAGSWDVSGEWAANALRTESVLGGRSDESQLWPEDSIFGRAGRGAHLTFLDEPAALGNIKNQSHPCRWRQGFPLTPPAEIHVATTGSVTAWSRDILGKRRSFS